MNQESPATLPDSISGESVKEVGIGKFVKWYYDHYFGIA